MRLSRLSFSAPPVLSAVAAAALACLLSPAPASAAGLLTPTDPSLPPLRVTDHLVDVTVRDGVAITTVNQVFRNDTKQRLEATYVFPLPEAADLTDFQMSFNGKMAQGKVLPAEEAARIYESIVRQAKDPGLIEFIGRRLLQMRVFPIEPESDTRIQVRYQQICRPISGMKGYHYPLRTRKTAGQAYGTVRFAVALETSAPLKNIWSPTHAVEIVRGADERTARIAYEAKTGSLEDDFLLLYDTDASDLGLATVCHKPGVTGTGTGTSTDGASAGHFVLMLTPKQLWPEEEYQPQDIVFVFDTSGSMAGDKLDQARRSLGFCIESLDERDRFSVVRFSTGFDALTEDLREATRERKAEAQDWVGRFTARGGTNIADTLQHVAMMERDRSSRETRSFVVVFLTDGQGNREPAEIMNRLADATHAEAGAKPRMRIFPFGVGHDVNTKLLDRLSAEYTGRTTYVQPGENLELVLGDFFSVISRPVLTDLRITLPEIGATERFPATLGDLYHGQQVIVAGRFSRAMTGPVRLTAMRNGERVEYAWPHVAFAHTPGADYVPTVWAGRKIAYLIDQVRTNGESTEMIDEILALSTEYGIQTPYTSWLVNPEQTVTTRAGIRRRGGAVPTSPPGFGGGGGSGDARRAAPRQKRRAPGSGFGPGGSEQERALRRAAPDAIAGSMSRSAEGEAGLYGDEFYDLDLFAAEGAVTEDDGKAANLIARKNIELREARTRDASRLDRGLLPYVKHDGVWYNRLGRFLVDETVGETTEIVPVKFASAAYFELVRQRKDLRSVLAASSTVVVVVGDDLAVLVSDRVGAESFTDADRAKLGIE